MDWPQYLFLFVFGFSAGTVVGKYLADRLWRANSRTYHQKESGGKLYKVTEVGPHQPE